MDAPDGPSANAQYEAYPYPDRDPAEEASRLITGSPSHPVEIDHFLFGGRRDWSQPFRALVAGGGTGDGLVMLAQKLADISCLAEITYLDMSQTSRAIAEARAAARGLNVRFVTADLLTAPDHGPFDYIDCCGVLHHLPDPDAGFAALASALAPEGGMGLMVYAPLGRSGVYPLQSAFGQLLADEPPRAKVRLARAALETLPEVHPFRRNAVLGDHRDSDAGLHDLLLHARDRAYSVADLVAALERADLELASMLEPARYDPMRYLPEAFAGHVKMLDPVERMTVAEQLAGNIKTHIAYAAPKGRGRTEARPVKPDLVPHLSGMAPAALARQIDTGKAFFRDPGRPPLSAGTAARYGPVRRADRRAHPRRDRWWRGLDRLSGGVGAGTPHADGFQPTALFDRGRAMTVDAGWVLPEAPYLPFMDARTARRPGLLPLDMGEWTVRHADYSAQMTQRAKVMRDHVDLAIAALSDAEPAELELLSLLIAHREGARRSLTLKERFCPLTAMAHLFCEDFCIMQPDAASGEYRLTAAVLCFPSRWLLSEKMGRPLTIIHDPVPDYDDDLARRVNRVFESIRSERPMVRVNWTIHLTPELFLPLGLSDKKMMVPGPEGRLYLRTERQTLVRLPETGAVVFGIKTSISPLETLAPDAALVLLRLTAEHDPAERAYRGAAEMHARKVEVLERLAGGAA